MRVLLVASFANIGANWTLLGVYVMMQITGLDPRDILFTGLKTIGI